MSDHTHHDIKPHSVFAKTIHWSFAALFAYAIYKQVDDVSQLSEPGLLRFEVIFAAAFLGLLVARFFFMRSTRPSALPESTPAPMRYAARVGHLAMYVSVGMIAVSGLLIGAVYASGARDGALLEGIIGLHELSVTASYVTIALHVSAALFHRLKGDGIWSAMVPVFREKT